MIDFPLHLDPFDRRHIGKNGAFIHRTNRAHLERCIAALRPNMGQFYDEPVPKLKLVTNKRRAA